jgi:hypothetical protein
MMLWFSIARFADLQGDPLVGNQGRRVGKALQRRGRKDGRRDRPAHPIDEIISARCDLRLRDLAARLQAECEKLAGRRAELAAQHAALEAARENACGRLEALKGEDEPDAGTAPTPGQDALARRARAMRSADLARLAREIGQLGNQLAALVAEQTALERDRDELAERYTELAAAEIASAEQLHALYVAGRVEKGAAGREAMPLRPLPNRLRGAAGA